MGLFDFAREAGEKLREKASEFFSGDAEAAEAASEELRQTVKNNDLSVDDFNVTLEGDKAILRGKAATQADREKAILAVGNTAGIGQVDDQMDVQESAPEAQFYTVQSGDSLSKIAKQFYGDASKYPAIFEANKPMLKDPDLIYPGQNLRIPPLG